MPSCAPTSTHIPGCLNIFERMRSSAYWEKNCVTDHLRSGCLAALTATRMAFRLRGSAIGTATTVAGRAGRLGVKAASCVFVLRPLLQRAGGHCRPLCESELRTEQSVANEALSVPWWRLRADGRLRPVGGIARRA